MPELKISNYDKDYNLREFPVLSLPARKLPDGVNKDAQIDMIKVSIAKIEATLKPATANQIKEILGRLALHKGIGAYSETQANVLINDYVRLLNDCPPDLLNKACDECILDPHMQYFPQVGIIRAKMGSEMTLRQLYLGRLRKILELSSGQEMREMKRKPIELGAQLAARFKAI